MMRGTRTESSFLSVVILHCITGIVEHEEAARDVIRGINVIESVCPGPIKNNLKTRNYQCVCHRRSVR
jgi:hypothetical protein